MRDKWKKKRTRRLKSFLFFWPLIFETTRIDVHDHREQDQEMSSLSLDYDDKNEILAELERRRKARTIAVTVDDGEIKAQLRSLNQPICLFGEGPADRRERLRQILSKIGEDALKKDKEEKQEDNKDPQETWYHEGPARLREARFWIADYSLLRAKKRVERMKLESSNTNPTLITATRRELFNKMQNFEILCSQVGDSRPISGCELSPDDSLIATSSWSGQCKLWSIDDLDNCLKTFRGHTCRVGTITFHPESTRSQDRSAVNLASCSVDGTVNLWSLENDEPISTIKGHQPNRVSKLKFHPSGRFLGTCCFDKSWRLFDLEYSLEDEILFQEGHSKPVYDIDFNSDGSLAVTGGLDSFGRVFDLRTGKCIMFLEGHLKGIISVYFSPNGYHIVTGSEDHSAKVWNLREQKLEYTISAHTNVISKVLFDKQSGNYILTASYDNTIRLWSSPSWAHIKTLAGHESKVMCADVSSDNEYIVSGSYDRTFKLWEKSDLL